jgi:hypothetical protein
VNGDGEEEVDLGVFCWNIEGNLEDRFGVGAQVVEGIWKGIAS